MSLSWQNLPDLIYSDIMVMLGLNSFTDLHKCRKVCRIWNQITSQMSKNKKATIRTKVESLAAPIRAKWVDWYAPSLPEIFTAAKLAHHGMLGAVRDMRLRDVDLGSAPVEHLASLASCVTRRVTIENVSNCDIVNILDSVKCQWLYISGQTLSSEENQAMIRALDSGVEKVHLDSVGEASLDIKALSQYRKQGKTMKLQYSDKKRS